MPGPDVPAPLTAASLLGGRYRLVRLLANGGMAAVWEGHDEVLARSVAVKVLHPHLADDRVFQERFRREAVSAARLSHPSVVATFDAGTAATGTAYIVMELVRGTTLRQLLSERGQLPPYLAVGIAAQIADALAHAHAAGLVHRDVKPANVLLCRSDAGLVPQVKVTDFGIAKAAEGVGGLDLTRTGMLMGHARLPEPGAGRGGGARRPHRPYASGSCSSRCWPARCPSWGRTTWRPPSPASTGRRPGSGTGAQRWRPRSMLSLPPCWPGTGPSGLRPPSVSASRSGRWT